MNYEKLLKNIRSEVKDYLIKNKIKNLVIGVSGGLDSGLNSYILKPVCDELGIKLIGRYIHIETNKPEEKKRAVAVGLSFCSEFETVDLTELYKLSLNFYEEGNLPTNSVSTKIRRGNIKARMRMIHLYNLAYHVNGIVVDNDNLTEHELGFWTLNGDVGDITPLAKVWKSDIYKFTKWIISVTKNETDKTVLQSLVDATPTDGLGITSSDLEQFGVSSYDIVDDILKTWKNLFVSLKGLNKLYLKYGEKETDSVIRRHINSAFKRNHPYKINPF